MYAVIDPEKSLKNSSRRAKVFQFFGCEDSVFNHASLLAARQDSVQTYRKRLMIADKFLSKRIFSVTSLAPSEFLVLTVQELDRMKKEFPGTARAFYKLMIQ